MRAPRESERKRERAREREREREREQIHAETCKQRPAPESLASAAPPGAAELRAPSGPRPRRPPPRRPRPDSDIAGFYPSYRRDDSDRTPLVLARAGRRHGARCLRPPAGRRLSGRPGPRRQSPEASRPCRRALTGPHGDDAARRPPPAAPMRRRRGHGQGGRPPAGSAGLSLSLMAGLLLSLAPSPSWLIGRRLACEERESV